MNKMTWLDLYNFLYDQAHDFKNLGKFDWSSPVVIHDAETGDEHFCDTWMISDKTNEEKPVLLINAQEIYK
jgi:hypothetical protein